MKKKKDNQELLKTYGKSFSVTKLWLALAKGAQKVGVKSVYSILLLFYAYRRKETPSWAKRTVIGTLGYFVSPIDAIPDITPIVGYTDDIGVLSLGVVTIAAYINDEVRTKAKKRLSTWFKNYSEEDIADVGKTDA